MNDFSVGKVTGAVILYTVKGSKKDGTYPLKFRLTHNRDVIFIGSGFDLTEATFKKLYGVNPVTSKPYRLSLEESKTKKFITASLERIKESVEEIHEAEEYSHLKLRNKLKRGRAAYIEVAFDNKIAELNHQERVGTAASYETARKFITKFASNLRFIDITPQWLEKFERWALSTERVTETTLGIYLRSLRALFNEAIRNGDIPRAVYPFHSADSVGYRIPTGSGTKIALTVEQINKIATIPLTGSQERCRDMFMLSFHLGGINIKDLLLLKWKNIKNGEVHFVREKTRHTLRTSKNIVIPLTEPAKLFIDKWGNADKRPDAFVINYLTDDMHPAKQRDSIKFFTKQVNFKLKEIGRLDNIKIEGLSSMVARHSFATILKNSGAPIAFIGETLGHTSSKTTESYLKSFESEQRRKQFDVIAKIGGSDD